jgi:ASCH domain-containing protein
MLRREDAEQMAHPAAVDRGLVIQQPWVGMIAEGKKTWEMRTKRTRVRGWVGLIEKGTGQVIGVAYLKNSPPELQRHKHHLHYRKHRMLAEPGKKSYSGKYLFPWVVTKAIKLAKPVPYEHPSGAVTWVKFSDEVGRALARQIRTTYREEQT